MQSVGDQVTQLVANLEHDHIVALQRVDELAAANASISAENDAVKSASRVLEKQLADRTSALADTEKRMDEALAQVEVVANAALNMLRTVRGQRASLEAVQGSARADTAPSLTPAALIGGVLADTAPRIKQFTAKDLKALIRGGLAGLVDADPRFAQGAPTVSETLQDSVAFMKGDISGSAQKAGIIKEAEAALAVDATQQDTAAIVDDVAIDPSFGGFAEINDPDPRFTADPSFGEQVAGDIMAADDKIVGDSGDEMVDLSTIRQALDKHLAELPPATPEPVAPPLAPVIAPPVELDAVDRMRRSSADLLPAPSLSGSSGPVLVVRNEPLPIFLARDTVFGRNDPRL